MPLFGPPNIENLKERRDVRGLAKALSHKDVTVRRNAARALEALAVVRAIASDPLVAVQQPDHVLVEWGKEVPTIPAEPLIAALKDDDGDVRRTAARALEEIGGTEAERALAEHRAQQT